MLLPMLTHIFVDTSIEPGSKGAHPFREVCRRLGNTFRARSYISFKPPLVKSRLTALPKPLLDALVDAFTMGKGILRGQTWVQIEGQGVFEQFAYDDWRVATNRFEREGGILESSWFCFFIAYKPTIDHVGLEEDVEH